MNNSQPDSTPQTPESLPNEILPEAGGFPEQTVTSEIPTPLPEAESGPQPGAAAATSTTAKSFATMVPGASPSEGAGGASAMPAHGAEFAVAAPEVAEAVPAEEVEPPENGGIAPSPQSTVKASGRHHDHIPASLIEPPQTSWAGKLVFYLTTLLVLVALVMGAFWVKKLIREFQDQRFLRDVQVIQEAFNQYSKNRDETVPSVVPQEIRESLGGQWHVEKIEKSAGKEVTEVVIQNPDRSMAEMEALDAKIDDGNLSTGKFTLKGRDVYSIKVLQTTNPLPQEAKRIRLRKEEPTVLRPPTNADELDSNYLRKNP